MSYDVWISTEDRLPDSDPSAGDDAWQRVGHVDMSNNSIAKAVARPYGASAKDYIMMDTSAPWVADVLARHPSLKHGNAGDVRDRFWLAIAFGGSYRITNQRASLTTVAKRPPETHPGLIGSFVPFPVKLTGGKEPLFRTRTS